MAFRDDTEALRARVERLESELGEANSKIAILEGGEDDVDEALLPKLKAGWKRRSRTFVGELTSADHERIVQMVQKASGKLPVTTSLVGRILTLKSGNMEVTITPGEGDDELVMALDSYAVTPHYGAIILMMCTLMMSLGVGLDGSAVGAAVFAAVGTALSYLAFSKTKSSADKTANTRTELFARLGTLIDERTSNVRVETAESRAAVGVEEPQEVPVEELEHELG